MFRNWGASNQRDLQDHILLTAYVAEFSEWDNRAHIERVRRYVNILAKGCGLGQSEAELLSLAAILHDIGKIALPAGILRKTTSLEPAEYKAMERHAEEGAKILGGSNSPLLQAAETIALTHHERWDGSGYPSGLKGEKIPLSGRIMAVADVFDALTTRRSYKTVVEPEAALELIRQSSGVLFDPKVVSVLSEDFAEFKAVLHQKLPGDAAKLHAD